MFALCDFFYVVTILPQNEDMEFQNISHQNNPKQTQVR